MLKLKSFFVHPSADVQSSSIGSNTSIWQNVIILPSAIIGKNCNICAHCFIENDVVIGDNVTIKCGDYLWDGVRISDNVFIGPNVTFSNDKHPRSKVRPEFFLETKIEYGASIGAGAVLLPGICIGRHAMVGAGSVVTHSVPPFALVKGNPARITGYIENPDFPALTSDIVSIPEKIGAVPTSVNGVTVHRMRLTEDTRGSLTVGEFMRDIPFVPKRYFLVYGVPSSKTRGEHAHCKCHQFLICIKGSCSVVVDDGSKRCEVLLDDPSKGIFLPPLIWGIQYKYSSDAMLLVFASEFYDTDDYIRDYSKFIQTIGLQ